MMKEIWKKIPDYPNYMASNYGRIKSLNYRMTKGKEKVMKPTIDTNGYMRIDLFNNKKRKSEKVSRVVAKTFIPNPNNYPCVNHKNAIRNDDRVENLEWCTHSYNSQYAIDNGFKKIKVAFGVQHGHSKLNPDKVREIRRMYETGKYSQRKLGEIFGVHQMTVQAILKRKNWKHVK